MEALKANKIIGNNIYFFFITITTISIIGKGDSGDPPSRCLVKGRERVADPVAESTLTGTAQ